MCYILKQTAGYYMAALSMMEIRDFSELFRGRRTAFGLNMIQKGKKDEKGKQKSINKTITSPCSFENYRAHLDGEKGLGIIPITEEDDCYFGAIDIDEYKEGSQFKLLQIIYRAGMPLLPFRSKSGGTHLFVFFHPATPIKAGELISLLQEFKVLLGLPSKTEIFPKQKTIAGSIGNWINLPYFGRNTRTLISADNTDIDFHTAIQIIKENRTSKETILRYMNELPFSDGPPCLQQLTLQGVEDNRNNYLFSAARYYKSKYGIQEYESYTRELNNSLEKPLDEKELEITVFSSHRKVEYTYRCHEVPLCNVCNKNKCKTREFGIGNSEVSELSFGEMKQYLSDPPYYTWQINEKEFTFYKEEDILQQKTFQKLCFRLLHIAPATLKEPAWLKIVNSSSNNMATIGVDSADSFQDGATFNEFVTEFLTERVMAVNKTQLMLGKTFREVSKRGEVRYLFDARKLKEFLFEEKRFRKYTPTEIGIRLRAMGAQDEKMILTEGGKEITVWVIPEKALQKYMIDKTKIPEIDFEIEESMKEAF